MHCTLPSSFQLRTDTPYYLHGYLGKEARRYFLLRNSICIEIHQLREKTSASYCMSDILLVHLKYRKQRSKWYRSELSRWSLAMRMKFLVICCISHVAYTHLCCIDKQFRWYCTAHRLSLQSHMPVWQFVDRGTAILIAFTKRYQRVVDAREFSRRKKSSKVARVKKKEPCRKNTCTIQQLNVWHLAGLRIIEMKRWQWKRSVIVKRTGVIGKRKRKQRTRPRVENRAWERRNLVVIRGARRFLPSTIPTGGPRHCSRSGINK